MRTYIGGQLSVATDEQAKVDDVAKRLAELYALEPRALNNPYPIYAALREHAPVLRVGPMVSVSRYEDVKNVLRDAETFSSRRSDASNSRVQARLQELGPDELVKFNQVLHHDGRQLPNMDDPEHARLRRFVNETFSAKRINQWRQDLYDIANELLDAVDVRGGRRFELIGDFSFYLPFRMICRILGVPRSEEKHMRAWGQRSPRASAPTTRILMKRMRPSRTSASMWVH
jgi:cytochrome P450